MLHKNKRIVQISALPDITTKLKRHWYLIFYKVQTKNIEGNCPARTRDIVSKITYCYVRNCEKIVTQQ